MAKIENMTPEQERELIAFRDRMWQQGVCCEPANRSRAEAAIAAAYAEIGKPAPLFLWMPSPMTCALALHVLGNLEGQAGLGAGLEAGLRAGLEAGLWDGLGAGLRDGLGDGLGAGLRAGLRDGLRDGHIDPEIGNTWWWGQIDTFWLAYYRFGSDLGVRQHPDLMRRLGIMEEIAASCGFWYPRDGVCIVSDRFDFVRWDEARNAAGLPTRLHADDGPAVRFRDGWSLYYWHGQRIPTSYEWIITAPARITAEVINAEPNAELRRIMLERTQFRPILDRAATISEDTDGNGHRRRLLAARIGDQTVRMVEVVNGSLEPDGTRKTYILGAMPGDTPHAAVAASYGIAPKLYREAVRT